tara:strand:- start:91 stop:513 length:423 start_codon:yes stop_codon:yes gene_type:complete
VTETYQGKPCGKYGHTERYVSNRMCVVCMKAHNKKWNAENPEERKAFKEKHKERSNAWARKYKKENRGLCNHYQALRRARIKQQTPPWANLDKIKEIFINCPKGYEVDHIHPLSKGGLHVDYNLQHLSISENRRKHNTIL